MHRSHNPDLKLNRKPGRTRNPDPLYVHRLCAVSVIDNIKLFVARVLPMTIS